MFAKKLLLNSFHLLFCKQRFGQQVIPRTEILMLNDAADKRCSNEIWIIYYGASKNKYKKAVSWNRGDFYMLPGMPIDCTQMNAKKENF